MVQGSIFITSLSTPTQRPEYLFQILIGGEAVYLYIDRNMYKHCQNNLTSTK